MSAALRGFRELPGRLLVGGLVVMIAAVGVFGTQMMPGGTAGALQQVMELLRSGGKAGPVLFFAVHVIAVLSGAVPASLLGVAAGAVFGLVPGFLLAATGNMVGAVIAFSLSRSLFRAGVERFLARHGRLRSFDASLLREGWKLIGLMRLSPVMPFSAMSYLLGLSTVRFVDYTVGTLASLVPLLGYVFLGTLTDAGLSAWAGGTSPVRWVLLGVGGVATVFVIVRLGRLALQRTLAFADDGRPASGRCP